MKRERIWTLDILKIICALFVFARHSHTMGARMSYYVFTDFIVKATGPIMTIFFIVSGMTIFMNYSKRDLLDTNGLICFYLKRLIKILPAYYCINIIAGIIGNFDIKQVLILQPVEILGIQTWYDSLFGIFHNGGTWFVSCILFCYFIYPVANQLLKNATVKVTLCLLAILLFISAYSTFIISTLQLGSLYSNPLFRMLEFLMGICLGRLWFVISENKHNNQRFYICGFCISAIIVICNIAGFVKIQGIVYLLTAFLCVFILTLSLIKIHPGKMLKVIISKFSNITYDIYVVQSIIWFIYFWVVEKLPVITSHNRYKILFGYSLVLGLAAIVHLLVEKPIQSILGKKLAKSKFNQA